MTKEHYAFAPTPEEAAAYQQGFDRGLRAAQDMFYVLACSLERENMDKDTIIRIMKNNFTNPDTPTT